jgi:hypothetical protein
MIRFAKITALVSLFIHLSLCGQAQKILVFDRDASARRVRFQPCDEIAVHINDEWIDGEILEITDSTILIRDYTIPVSQITAIKYQSRSSWAPLCHALSSMLPEAGVVLLSFDAISSVINKDYPVYSESTLITAGALIASGPIFYLLAYHKFKINKHHRLKVIDISIR